MRCRTFLCGIEELKDIPEETIKYVLESDNNLIQAKAGFDKEIVCAYDYATLRFELLPAVRFCRGVHYVLLNFSDESLNKIIYLNKDGPITLSPEEKYSFNVLLYILPQAGSQVALKSISVIINLNKYFRLNSLATKEHEFALTSLLQRAGQPFCHASCRQSETSPCPAFKTRVCWAWRYRTASRRI